MFLNIPLVHYSEEEEKVNVITHAAGIVLSFVVLVLCLKRALDSGKMNVVVSAIVYGGSMILMYGASAFYHGLSPGKLKRFARLIDYCAVFILIAGTATPCALAGVYGKNRGIALFIFFFAWACAIIGIVMSAVAFEKTKAARLILYIGEGLIMFASVLPIKGSIIPRALHLLFFGSLIYVAGMFFLWLGKTKKYAHGVFHIVVIMGSLVHFYVMLKYIFV